VAGGALAAPGLQQTPGQYVHCVPSGCATAPQPFEQRLLVQMHCTVCCTVYRTVYRTVYCTVCRTCLQGLQELLGGAGGEDQHPAGHGCQAFFPGEQGWEALPSNLGHPAAAEQREGQQQCRGGVKGEEVRQGGGSSCSRAEIGQSREWAAAAAAAEQKMGAG
jgi:hypothetical protein